MSEQVSAVSELEARRRAARLHDQSQRDAQERDEQRTRDAEAEQKRKTEAAAAASAAAAAERAERSSVETLAALLVKRDGELITAGEARAVLAHIEQRIDALEAQLLEDEDA